MTSKTIPIEIEKYLRYRISILKNIYQFKRMRAVFDAKGGGSKSLSRITGDHAPTSEDARAKLEFYGKGTKGNPERLEGTSGNGPAGPDA